MRSQLPAAAGRRAATARSARRSRGFFLLAASSAAVLASAGLLAARRASSSCWLVSPSPTPKNNAVAGRRGALAAATAALFGASTSDPAGAFENAVKQIKRDLNNPKRKGLQPSGLGLDARNDLSGQLGIKECTEKAPNCFSTTGNPGIDAGFHLVEPWTWSGKNRQAVIEDVKNMINAYPPGQGGIDGGGFQIQAADDDCVYIQFEALKRGYLDDVEFCIQPGTPADASSGNLLLRSSSRQGFYDYGTNAARMNKLASIMDKIGGWKTWRIDRDSHPTYWSLNCDGGKGRKAPWSVEDRFPKECGV